MSDTPEDERESPVARAVDPASAARQRVERAHAETLADVRECAEAVAATWDGPTATDRTAVVAPTRAALERGGTLARLPRTLADAVDATGRSLPADPVPAPPYVAVTSVGPVLRATLSDGRLVVTLRTFAVERGADGADATYSLAPSLTVDVDFRR